MSHQTQQPKAFPAESDRSLQLGMDLRDYFAAKAMVICAQMSLADQDPVTMDTIAGAAYTLADAMMERRRR